MSGPQARALVHHDIKPSIRPELASHYLDVPNMPWEPTKFPGIRIKVLYSDDSGITTALFKLDPGAVVPLHEHTALEQTFVLEGTLEDHEGVCGPGQFVCRPPGNQHEPAAPHGTVILRVYDAVLAVRVLGGFVVFGVWDGVRSGGTPRLALGAPSRQAEFLPDALGGLVGAARHVAGGASSPIPAAAALLARERGGGRP